MQQDDPENPSAPKIIGIQSKTWNAIYRHSFFEWHMGTQKLYVILPPKPPRTAREGILISESIRTSLEAKHAVAGFVAGYQLGKAHALDLSKR